MSKPNTHRTDHDLDDLDPVCVAMVLHVVYDDLCGADPMQEACARSFR